MTPRAALGVGFLVLLATGCGDDDEAAPCTPGGLAPGSHAFVTTHDGLERRYRVHVPAGHEGTPLPLVFNLHPLVLGGGLVPDSDLFTRIWTHESGLDDVADVEGFVVVQPDGTGFPASWNAGDDCCSPANANEVDDVGFLRSLLDGVSGRTCVDRSRVYATGMSNGGFLSHRLACEASDWITAIAPVVGSFSDELTCELTRPVPVLQVTGTEDSFASRTASFERWVGLDGCTDAPEVTYQVGNATCVTHDTCDGGVEVGHCVVEGGGHCWFSDIAPQFTPFCGPRDDLDTPEMVWDFLRRWRLGG